MSCPRCNLDTNTFCDNDCGTFYYYRSTDGELITGHNPECGVDTQRDTIQSDRVYDC